jgi:uncharacterized protein YdhG (YjbR/CyaY superfamily)
MSDKPTTVEAYIETCVPAVQPTLHEITRRIRTGAPGVTETIAYGMPKFTFSATGYFFVGAWKAHLGIYPVPEVGPELSAALDPYRAAKGTLRFPLSQPFPFELLDRLVAAVAPAR